MLMLILAGYNNNKTISQQKSVGMIYIIRTPSELIQANSKIIFERKYGTSCAYGNFRTYT